MTVLENCWPLEDSKQTEIAAIFFLRIFHLPSSLVNSVFKNSKSSESSAKHFSHVYLSKRSYFSFEFSRGEIGLYGFSDFNDFV